MCEMPLSQNYSRRTDHLSHELTFEVLKAMDIEVMSRMPRRLSWSQFLRMNKLNSKLSIVIVIITDSSPMSNLVLYIHIMSLQAD